MYALNRIKLIGYLTEAAELRTLPSGAEVCELNLRVISKTLRGGKYFDSTSFHSVTCWAGIAKTATQYTQAGSQVYIEGRLRTDSWENDEGKKRYKTRVIAEDLLLLNPMSGQYPALQSESFATGLNEVELIGNLTKDLELRQTTGGHNIGSTSLATNRKWKDKMSGELREETTFHNLVLWDDIAIEGGKNLKKGQRVYIKGRMQVRSWDSPEGEKRYTAEVVVESVAILGHEAPSDVYVGTDAQPTSASVPQSGGSTSSQGNTADSSSDIPSIKYESDITADDLPF